MTFIQSHPFVFRNKPFVALSGPTFSGPLSLNILDNLFILYIWYAHSPT